MELYKSSLHKKYMGICGICDLFGLWRIFSEKDYGRYMKVNEYLNDVLANNENTYLYPPEKVREIGEKGTRIMQNMLVRYGMPESVFSDESVMDEAAEISYMLGFINFQLLDESFKKKAFENAAERIESLKATREANARVTIH